MSRNVKDLQRRIFDRIADAVSGTVYGPTEAERAKVRWVLGEAKDTDALAHASLLKLEYFPGIGVVSMVEWQGQQYAVTTVDISSFALHAEHVLPRINNAGLCCLLFDHQEVPVQIAEPAEVREYIAEREGGFSLDEMWRFFPQLAVYPYGAVMQGLPREAAWSALRALCACSLASCSRLPWIVAIGHEFEDICTIDAARVIGGHLLHSVLSGTWHHCFLELYRGLEVLYRIGSIQKFMDLVPGIPCAEIQLTRAIDSTLGWRMRDDRMLVQVLAELGTKDREKVAKLLKCGSKPDVLGKRLYRVRNAVVHGNISGEVLASSGINVEPPSLVRAMLIVVRAAHDAIPTRLGWFQ